MWSQLRALVPAAVVSLLACGAPSPEIKITESSELEELERTIDDPLASLEGEDRVAFGLFLDAIAALQEKGDREKARAVFAQVASDHPDCRWAEQSRELSEQLAGMVCEDAERERPGEPEEIRLVKSEHGHEGTERPKIRVVKELPEQEDNDQRHESGDQEDDLIETFPPL